MNKPQWGTLVVQKTVGGRAVIQNSSQRGLWSQGEKYYNHNLKNFPPGSLLGVVVRLSPKGRRMVQQIHTMNFYNRK